MKKIAFTTSGDSLQSELDPRFGRSLRFLLYDLDQKTFELVENRQARNAAQGAGIQAAETVVRAGADVLVSGHCGPKAFRVLQAAGVAIYNCENSTVEQALEKLLAGSLTLATSADVEGHW